MKQLLSNCTDLKDANKENEKGNGPTTNDLQVELTCFVSKVSEPVED